MTDGEKMVWAVAYVHALTSEAPRGMATAASAYADTVINQLRFAGKGEMWSEMVDAPPGHVHPSERKP